MKTTPLIAMAALALALSACSGSEPAPEASASGAASAAPDQALATNDSIPEFLRGRWAISASACSKTPANADGQLSIGADKLAFYESEAKLGMIEARTADSITGSFEFSGEGETWVSDATLASVDGGKTLLITETGPNAAPRPLKYTKCP